MYIYIIPLNWNFPVIFLMAGPRGIHELIFFHYTGFWSKTTEVKSFSSFHVKGVMSSITYYC